MKQALTVRLPDELRKNLQQISEAEAKPISDLVRESDPEVCDRLQLQKAAENNTSIRGSTGDTN